MSNPLTQSQKSVIRSDVAKAIGEICDAWPDALAAAAARGYPTGVGGGSIGGGVGTHGDPTSAAAFQPSKADVWIADTRRTLAFMLSCSAGVSGRRWTGAFDPPRLRQSLVAAGIELIELWPKNVMRLFQRLYDLSNQAKREWPPTPRKGMKIGDVVVGRDTPRTEVCSGCGLPAVGDAADPIVRIDGKPYHKATCYKRARRLAASTPPPARQPRRVNPLGSAELLPDQGLDTSYTSVV